MEYKTLLLNSDYSPLKTITWQKAICLWYSDKIDILEDYPEFKINSVSMSINCPSVAKLQSYKKTYSSNRVRLSRYNLFCRDKFTCQYCGYNSSVKELTIDHVVPRLHGGKTEWNNIVTACIYCNNIKGSKLLEDFNMKLKKNPFVPKISDVFQIHYRDAPNTWKYYLNIR